MRKVKMRSFGSWKFLTIVTAFLGVFFLAQVFFQTQPPQAQAQGGGDIDDVVDQFSGDFGFTGKEDVKQQNVQNANEQNREDIQLKIEEERKKALEEANAPAPLATTANVTVNFSATINNADVTTSLGPVSGFMGIISTVTPVNHIYMAVPIGVNILTINCLGTTPGPNCNITLSGIVNATCVPTTLTIVASFSGTSTCTVTAPVPMI